MINCATEILTMNYEHEHLNVWNKWCATVNEHRKVEDIPAKELNRLLSHFIVSLKKKNGEDYEPNSMTAFQRSIDRHLREKGVESCVSVFKALSTLEKTVDHCRIRLDETEGKLVFIFHCRHGKMKTHNLGYQDTDTVQAVFNKEHCSNRLRLQAKILSEVVSNFPGNLDEVTMTVESAGLRLKNYVDEAEDDDSRVSLTEIALTPGEFDGYQVSAGCALTFCLKELRALLHFTDTISHCLSLKFEGAGKPLIVSIEDDRDYQADMVLATLLDDSTPPHPTQTAKEASSHPSHTTSAAETSLRPSQVTGSAAMAASVSSFSSAPTTTAVEDSTHRQTQPASVSATRRRLGQTAAWRGESAAMAFDNREEDDVRDTSRSTTVVNRNSGRSVILPTSSSGPNVFPSGSQFQQTNSRPPARPPTGATVTSSGVGARISQVSHIPLPPHDVEVLDVELMETSVPGGKGTAARPDPRGNVGLDFGPARSAGLDLEPGGSNVGVEFGMDDDDVMDALFGEDYMDGGVAQGGDAFRFDGAQDGGGQPPDGVRHGTTSEEEEFGHSPQGSGDMNDSNILPGTPPSKKFKLTSVLFGLDMFGNRSNDSEILAPDSEPEDDF